LISVGSFILERPHTYISPLKVRAEEYSPKAIFLTYDGANPFLKSSITGEFVSSLDVIMAVPS
jgi:hypothetical protein